VRYVGSQLILFANVSGLDRSGMRALLLLIISHITNIILNVRKHRFSGCSDVGALLVCLPDCNFKACSRKRTYTPLGPIGRPVGFIAV